MYVKAGGSAAERVHCNSVTGIGRALTCGNVVMHVPDEAVNTGGICLPRILRIRKSSFMSEGDLIQPVHDQAASTSASLSPLRCMIMGVNKARDQELSIRELVDFARYIVTSENIIDTVLLDITLQEHNLSLDADHK